MPGMDLLHLADFVMLAERRSFSSAAKERHVTQPAFSRRIKALEESIGVKLIDRATTPLTLTREGECLLQRAKELLSTSAEIEAEMRSMATQMPQSLHIQMSNSLSSVFFPSWYKAMQRQVKGLNFRVSRRRSFMQLDDLRAGRADFSIQIIAKGLPRTHNFAQTMHKVIGRDRLLLVQAAHLPKNNRALIASWADSYLTACLNKMLGPERYARMNVVFEGPGTEMSRGMALAGFGAALLQESLIADDLHDGYLVLTDSSLKPIIADVLLLRADRPLSPLAETVWDKSDLQT